MTTLEYPACVRELYESEIFGEAIALALLNAARNERDRYHFSTLLQLETETKARLRPFLYKHGLPLDEQMELPDIETMVAGYLSSSWPEFVAGLIPTVQTYLERFRQIADAGPEEDKDVLNSMVDHEAAILAWLKAEQDDMDRESLAGMISQLRFPLPAPSRF